MNEIFKQQINGTAGIETPDGSITLMVDAGKKGIVFISGLSPNCPMSINLPDRVLPDSVTVIKEIEGVLIGSLCYKRYCRNCIRDCSQKI